MIEVKNIYKSFNDLEVLKGVDLHIKKGEIVSIVGSSGAGKTTLLQILGTLDTPNSHKDLVLKINNENIDQLSNNEISSFRNQNIGFIFQFHQLLGEFTALENVCLPAYIQGISKKEAKERAIILLTDLGLVHRLNNKPNQLSGGEQQRVSVARALMNNPKVVFADEPSGNLDSKNANELHQLFFDLRNKYNQTFVIVTHNEDLANMADRKLTMKDGVIISSE